MKIAKTPTDLDQARNYCDAYFTFTINLIRDSIVSNYSFEEIRTTFTAPQLVFEKAADY